MKKILVVSMSAELGGIEKSLICFLRFLTEEKCEVDLMLWKKRGELLAKIPSEVTMIDSPSPGSFRNILKTKNIFKFGQYLKLKHYTRKQIPWKSFPCIHKEYDIAISFSQDGYSPYYVIDNVIARKKFMWYHHGAYEKSGADLQRDQKYYQLFSKIITVSNANKSMLIEKIEGISEKICVIPNLLDSEEILNSALEPCNFFNGFGGCKITTVGRVVKEKGQLFALDVAACLKARGFIFKWCFVGNGNEMTECIEKVKSLGLESNCFFVGESHNPYPCIYASDLYVQPSFVESEAISIREALILNKMILASDIPAIRETLHNGKYGYICAAQVDKFASAIEFFSNSENRKDYINKIALPERNVDEIKQAIRNNVLEA